MKIFSFIFLIFLFAHIVNAQITFQKTFDGDVSATFISGTEINQTSDNGYIIVSTTKYNPTIGRDVYLIKTDSLGDTLWTRIYGGNYFDYGFSVQQTTDDGYIITGYTEGDTTSPVTSSIFLIKTDANGDSLWTKHYKNYYGQYRSAYSFSVKQTFDGGYFIGGYIEYGGFDRQDFYLMKTDSVGNILWSESLGNDGNDVQDWAHSVIQTADSGYVIVGEQGGGGINWNILLIKTDAAGIFQWEQHYGGSGFDEGLDVQQTLDGGFIITGARDSSGNYDACLIKTDSYGNEVWSKTYGDSTMDDTGFCVRQTTDGGYIVTGGTTRGSGQYVDVYLIKTDSIGDTLWTRTFGGSGFDVGHSVIQTTDGGYVLNGYTSSFGTNANIFLIKTDSTGNSNCNQDVSTTIVRQPSNNPSGASINDRFTTPVVISPLIQIQSGGIVYDPCINVGVQSDNRGSNFAITIHPNPNSGYFTITNPETINRGKIEIYDVYGKIIFNKNINHTSYIQINLENIITGIYYVKVFDGGKTFCKKLIINHY